MLYINPDSEQVKNALNEHYKATRCLIWKKIGAKFANGKQKKCGDKDCSVCDSRIKVVENIPVELKAVFSDEELMKSLIIGSADNLRGVDEEIWKKIKPNLEYLSWSKLIGRQERTLLAKEKVIVNAVKPYFKFIEKVLAYKGWFIAAKPTAKYSAYHLAINLDRRSCTYCNRTYTNTMTTKDREKLMRPQFDHWYPKSSFPFLSLSFFNLIPSCYTCNSSSKGSMILNLDDHTHPYIDKEQLNHFRFDYYYSDSLDDFEISIQSDDKRNFKTSDALKALNVDTMYNAHIPELKDLIKSRIAYSPQYLETLKKSFPSANLTNQEIYRLAFGTELDPKDFHKRPMSKFKHDILIELGIIKKTPK